MRLLGTVVLEYGLSRFKLCGILVPRPEIKFLSPALQEVLTTGLPGKSPDYCFLYMKAVSHRAEHVNDGTQEPGRLHAVQGVAKSQK